jgi:anti-sigma factor RsiW
VARPFSIVRQVTCRDFASLIVEYLENELDATSRATFEQHLGVCPNCARYLAQYRATIVAARTVFQEPPGMLPPVPDVLMRAILVPRSH